MLSKKLLKQLQDYINKHLMEEEFILYEEILYSSPSYDTEQEELESYIDHHRKESFAQVLFRFIDTKGLDDVTVYKKAGIDRRHFSKIKSNPEYQVSKQTGIAFAFALELDIEETEELLHAAGFTLSSHDTFDLIIQFFLERKRYALSEVNEALEHFELKPF